MATCDAAHAELDGLVGKKVQIGPLPKWTRVQGKAAWTVVQGPYSGLSAGWRKFMQSVGQAKVRPAGPTGDVYACMPGEHAEDRLLTILYAPIE